VKPEGVEVTVDLGQFGPRQVKAKKAVVTSGAYTNDVISNLGVQIDLNIWEMVYGYYATNAGLGNLYPCAWF